MDTLTKIFAEAIDTGEYPDVINPQRKRAIAAGEEEITGILPDIGGSAAAYLEQITSKNYQKLMQRLEYYTGKKPTEASLPALTMQMFDTLRAVQGIESKNTKLLESEALELVLSLPEFKYIKEMVESGDIVFDVKLGPAELSNAITDAEKEALEKNQQSPEDEEGLNEGESDELALIKELQSDAKLESVLRRRLANTIMQGIATHGLFLFNLVEDRLKELDPKLVSLYGILCVATQLGYFIVPPDFSVGRGTPKAGSEEVIAPEEEGGPYTIKCRGITFPFLIHEIVKGVYEYMAIEGATPNDTLEAEIPDILYGPEFYNLLIKYIPDDKRELIPLVYKKVLDADMDDIKEILAGGGKAKTLIDQIVQQASDEMENYEKYED